MKLLYYKKIRTAYLFFLFCLTLININAQDSLSPKTFLNNLLKIQDNAQNPMNINNASNEINRVKFNNIIYSKLKSIKAIKLPSNKIFLQELSQLYVNSIFDVDFPNFSIFLEKLESLLLRYNIQKSFELVELFFTAINEFSRNINGNFSSTNISFNYEENGKLKTKNLQGVQIPNKSSFNVIECSLSGQRGGVLKVQFNNSKPPLSSFSQYTYMGEMTAILKEYSIKEGISVYDLFFPDEIEELRIAKEGIGIVLRNIGRKGIISFYKDPTSATLNSPPDGFPVTCVTKNYAWAASADFPGVEGNFSIYGDHVFAIFPQNHIKFSPMIRDKLWVEGKYGQWEALEYKTEDIITPDDILLLRNIIEYNKIVSAKVKNKNEALKLLNKSQIEQELYENIVVEESLLKENEINDPNSLVGIKINNTYIDLLISRILNPALNGMMFFLPNSGHLNKVYLHGNFNNWKEPIEMTRDNNGNWTFIMDAFFWGDQINKEYEFKFRTIDQNGTENWTPGIYRYEEVHENAILPKITEKEIFYTKDAAIKRLKAILNNPNFMHYRNMLPKELNFILKEINQPIITSS